MDILNINGYTLKNLNKINIVLGRNGCGKSLLLRSVEQQFRLQGVKPGKTRYITPERGGTLICQAGIEDSLSRDVSWLSNQRKHNQSNNFREQSVSQYRKLETLVLREIEKEKRDNHDYTFDNYVDKINSLLDNIRIERHDTAFKIFHKKTNKELTADSISSGESELITLGIECLIFSKECEITKHNVLFLDEPDVHLHPDLQVRLIHFLRNLVKEVEFLVLIATHSTAILGALETYEDTNIAFMAFDQKELEFRPVSGIYRKILPVFGAHPLSNVFNEAPIFLVEGEDDERIWQQAVRSSEGKIRIYPCSTDGLGNMNDLEKEAQNIIRTVYDNAKGYSLRDRDDGDADIDNIKPIIRIKLSCRNAENLLLCDEVLELFDITWNSLKSEIDKWLERNFEHVHYEKIKDFKEKGFDRKNADIKEFRNDLMGIIGSSKPWEVAVGQTVANLTWDDATRFDQDGSIYSFLGKKLVENILPRTRI